MVGMCLQMTSYANLETYKKKLKNACLYSINEYLTSSTCLPFKRIWTKNQSNLQKILRDKKKVRKFNEKVMPVACIWVNNLYTN